MQFILDVIRKIVVLVLLMELVMQLQPGKTYEPYIKMLVGIMVVFSIISAISSVFANATSFQIPKLQEFVWSDEGTINSGFANENGTENYGISIIVPDLQEIQVEQIKVEEIKVKEIKSVGGIP